jgi:simple sugar transport system permease protein
MRPNLTTLAAPLGALAITLVISSLALVAFGSNPIAAYGDMIGHAAKLETQVDIWNRATPLYLSAVAASIGFRMNLFNIGVEGQYLIAALVAAKVGGMITLPQVFHIAVVFLVAMAVGGAWAGLAGLLNVTKDVNVVISTIMLNFIAISGLMAWWVQAWQADLREGETLSATNLGTDSIADSGVLPDITGLVEIFTPDIRDNNPVSGMLVIAVLVGIGYHVLLNRTRFGFDLRSSGMNPFAARAGGVSPKRMIIVAMILSGAVAGLVGLVEVFEISKFRPNQIQGLGFAGIGVALLGRNHPLGMAFAALLFAFLDISSGILQSTETASREIVVIMQGIVLLAAVVAYEIVRRVREREEAKATAEALAEDGLAVA